MAGFHGVQLQEEVAELFREAQEITGRRLMHLWTKRRAATLQDHRDYYAFVRTAPAVRRKENAAISQKRVGARLKRAAERGPCPHCGAPVTRDAIVARGKRLPKYCSRKCMRAVTFRNWWLRQKAQAELSQ